MNPLSLYGLITTLASHDIKHQLVRFVHALKLTSGVSTAVLSAILAMEGKCVTTVEGIIDDDVDRSIRNLTRIGSQGMNETDRLVLDIMTSKQCN